MNEKGYSKENVKVLLGGWTAWKNENAKDATGYPITVLATPAAPVVINPSSGSPVVITPVP